METKVEQKPKTPLELLKLEVPQFMALIALNARKDVDVETIALQEIEFFRMHAVYKPDLLDCLPQTIIMAVKSVIKKNLSLDPSAGLVYVKTRNMKIKDQTTGADKWVKGLEIQETANGLISVNRQCGRILDIDRPEVKKDNDGKVIGVSVKYMVPSVNEQGKPSARWKIVDFDESDFYRWRRASHKENGRSKTDANAETLNYANENYTNWKGGPDPEFVRAKAIRHGLKKLGTNPHESITQKINLTQDIAHEIIVDPGKDAAATSDDIAVSYAENVEYAAEIEMEKQVNASQVKVTTHEIVNLETITL